MNEVHLLLKQLCISRIYALDWREGRGLTPLRGEVEFSCTMPAAAAVTPSFWDKWDNIEDREGCFLKAAEKHRSIFKAVILLILLLLLLLLLLPLLRIEVEVEVEVEKEVEASYGLTSTRSSCTPAPARWRSLAVICARCARMVGNPPSRGQCRNSSASKKNIPCVNVW